MSSILFSGLLFLLCVIIIYRWNRHAEQRRFDAQFKSIQKWGNDAQPLLKLIESAYFLTAGSGLKLPKTATPMSLYLVLYPTHCIYDACENEHFLKFLNKQFNIKPDKALLTTTFEDLVPLTTSPSEALVSQEEQLAQVSTPPQSSPSDASEDAQL